MNFYQSVFPEKKFTETICRKIRFGVITLQYLPFLVKVMTPIFLKIRLYIYISQIHGVTNNSKIFYILLIFLLET